MRVFVSAGLSLKGTRMVERLEKQGLLTKKGDGKIPFKKGVMGQQRNVTPKWVAQAKLRKRILR